MKILKNARKTPLTKPRFDQLDRKSETARVLALVRKLKKANSDSGKRPKHCMADWLALHELTPVKCEHVLAESSKYLNSDPADSRKIRSRKSAMDAEQVWQLAARALIANFARSQDVIKSACQNTRKDFQPDQQLRSSAFTLNDGGNGYPFVSCNYRGLITDSLIIAHEFSHSVQIVASKGRFVAPVIRETCAFIGELSLLSFSKTQNPELFTDLQQSWNSDNKMYLQEYSEILRSALNQPLVPYSYRWNYALARICSMKCQEQLTSQETWALFEGKLSLKELFSLLRL